MLNKAMLMVLASVTTVASYQTATAQTYRPGMLGVNTNLRSSPPPSRPAAPPPSRPATPPPAAAPRNIDLRPLPPRPLIERPAPAPIPEAARPRPSIQVTQEAPNQATVKVDVPVAPKTSLTGSATGTLNLPPNQGTPTLDAGTVGVSRETK